MNSKQKSIIFWLIFIIIVVILAIIAIPKYGALSQELRETHARNLVANLTSSSAANYTQRKFNSSTGVPITNCRDVIVIAGNHLLPGYQITDQAIQSDKVVICTLNGPDISAIQFSVIGIK